MRVPISAKVVANLLETVGVERVLTMDLHADQIQGFFDIPVDNIYASPVLLSDLQSKNYSELVVVSPDVGGVVRARALAKQLGCDLAIIDKRRPKANVSEVMHVIGEIEGRNCVIMDDMIDTAGTLVKAAEVLKERGARRVYAYCTHAVFSGPAIERMAASQLDEVVVTNTIPLSDAAKACKKIRVLTVQSRNDMRKEVGAERRFGAEPDRAGKSPLRAGGEEEAKAGKVKLFPPVLLHLIASGEATGKLPEMLGRAADIHSREAERRALFFTSLLEPVLILAMGVIVMLIVLAVLLPIIQLQSWVR